MAKERLTRYIGIDFGTSTSVVSFKDYRDGAPAAAEEPKLVVFEGNHPTVPTLVFTDAEGRRQFGYAAERQAGRSPRSLAANFKMDLVSDDPARRDRAAELLREFFRYLYRTYQAQRVVPPGAELEERTLVSYPAKWPDQVRAVTLQAAREAGFPNVSGMDEPSAALQYLLTMEGRQLAQLVRNEILAENAPLTALLVDMGAGTTDLVLYRFLPGAAEGHEVLATWPPVNSPLTFGGREVDDRLSRHLRELLTRDPDFDLRRLEPAWLARQCTPWKELEISPQLAADRAVHGPPEALILSWNGEFPPLDRTAFGEILADYLPAFPTLVNELLEHAVARGKISGGEEVDLVILTGGHSQWYFVQEILRGLWVPGLPGSPETGSGVRLPKIQAQPERVLTTPLPQQTVARGLALAGMPVRIRTVLTNGIWLELSLGLSRIEPFAVGQMGDSLPLEREFRKRLKFDYQPGKPILLGCTAYVGDTVETAVRFEPVQVRLGQFPLLKWMDTLAGWMGERQSQSGARLSLRLAIDEGQHARIKGTLDPDIGDPVKFEFELA